MLNIKTFFIKSMAILTALFSTQAFANDPQVLTQQVADKLFSQIKADQAKISQNPNHLKTLVRTHLMEHVDVDYAGKLILGNENLRTTSKEQQQAFFKVLDRYIEQVYAQALTLYSNQQISVEKGQLDASGHLMTIPVKILQGNQAPLSVNFYWRKGKKSGVWRVYDMAAEGSSVVATKKQEWAADIRKDFDGLIAKIEKSASAPIQLKK